MKKITLLLLLSIISPSLSAQSLAGEADLIIEEIEQNIISIRRDLHEHPELSNQEYRTSKIVAEKLKSYGIEVVSGIAKTGVVGILRGKSESPLIAFRADMDALPVVEAVDIPFASKKTAVVHGKTVGVMHACGHDVHTSILLGAAQTLSKLRDKLNGSVMFIFQPAEEGAPEDGEWGAKLMLKQGIFDEQKPDAIFGLHTWPMHTGTIGYSDGALMASADFFKIIVKGKGTHGAVPWGGIDPITTASQIILGVQTIVSRQLDLTKGGGVISFGIISGGTRENIIPEEVTLSGTIRALDDETRLRIYDKLKTTAENIARSAGASATVRIDTLYPVTSNDSKLAQFAVGSLSGVDGVDNLMKVKPAMVAEDFSFFQKVVPGFYFFLGIAPPDADLKNVPRNHSPNFFVDESSINIGMRAFTHLALDYFESR